jgi:subtilase family serine protease
MRNTSLLAGLTALGLVACADGQPGEAGTVGPDLVVPVVTSPPAGALPPAGPTVTAYFLSRDPVKSAADRPLGGPRAIGSLAPGATSTGTVMVTVPTQARGGTFRLLACADHGSPSAPEIDEVDSCRASAGLTTLPGGADLVVTAVTDPPAAAITGSGFTASDITRNQGNGDAAASTTAYRLSRDPVGSGDDLVLGTRAVPALAGGALSSDAAGVFVPAGTPAGTYFLIACADHARVVGESSEANCLTASGQVTVSGPDLRVIALAVGQASVASGGSITVTDEALNAGQVVAGSSHVHYLLSTDAARSVDDGVVGARAVPMLPQGGASAGGATLTIDAPAGDYVLLACADQGNAVIETDERNNCAASASFTVTAAP